MAIDRLPYTPVTPQRGGRVHAQRYESERLACGRRAGGNYVVAVGAPGETAVADCSGCVRALEEGV